MEFFRTHFKDKKNVTITILILVYIFLLAFGVVMTSPVNIWRNGDAGNDSSVYRYLGIEVARGGVPYRDSFEHKGPMIFIINYLGTLISYYRGIWLIELINLFATLCFLYKISRMKCGRLASCAVLFVSSAALFDYFKGGNMTEEYAMLYIAVSLYIFLDYFINGTISRFRLIACGFSFAAVFLLRANMISLWMVFAVAVLVDCLKKKEYASLRKFIGYFLIGTGILTIPILLWLALGGGFSGFIMDAFIDNFIYSGGTTMLDKWNTFRTFAFDELVLFLFVVLLYQVIKSEKSNRFLNMTYFIYYIVTLPLISVSGRPFNHYAMIMIPAMVYPLSYVGSMCEKEYEDGLKKAGIYVFIIYFLAYLSLPNWVNGIDNTLTCYQERNQEHHDGLVTVVTSVVIENTSPEDEITIYGAWNLIYILSHRMSASVYSYQVGIPEFLDDYFEEIEEAQPKLVIVQMKYMDDRMREFLGKYQYEKIWNDGEDKVEIYKVVN